MKRLLWLLAILISVSVEAATGPTAAFTPITKEYLFSVTTSSGTPVQIAAANPTVAFNQYRLVITCSSATAVVTTTFQTSSAAATTVTAPVGGTPQYTRTYPCSNPIETISGPSQAYFNAIVSSGTATVYIIGGEGL